MANSSFYPISFDLGGQGRTSFRDPNPFLKQYTSDLIASASGKAPPAPILPPPVSGATPPIVAAQPPGSGKTPPIGPSGTSDPGIDPASGYKPISIDSSIQSAWGLDVSALKPEEQDAYRRAWIQKQINDSQLQGLQSLYKQTYDDQLARDIKLGDWNEQAKATAFNTTLDGKLALAAINNFKPPVFQPTVNTMQVNIPMPQFSVPTVGTTFTGYKSNA